MPLEYLELHTVSIRITVNLLLTVSTARLFSISTSNAEHFDLIQFGPTRLLKMCAHNLFGSRRKPNQSKQKCFGQASTQPPTVPLLLLTPFGPKRREIAAATITSSRTRISPFNSTAAAVERRASGCAAR